MKLKTFKYYGFTKASIYNIVSTMKIAYIQTNPKFGKVAENLSDALKKVETASKKGAKLIVLPELFNTGYQFKNKAEARKLAEYNNGETVTALIEKAKKYKNHIVFGMAELHDNKCYNASLLVGPKGLQWVYHKTHLFSNEKKIFEPGNTPFKAVKISGGVKVGMMICFDWLFPEAARTLMLEGADIIAHPSNLVLPNCPDAMVTRALENRVYTITANRVGTENRIKGSKLTFIGKSEIVSPDGVILKRANTKTASIGIVDIDIKEARNKKVTPFNDILKDRRTFLYFKGIKR